jgi:hypothetical protein
MARLDDPPQLLAVDVHQLARPVALVADDLFAWLALHEP